MKKFTELVFIIDKSGSMSGLESDTIGGFNSLINKQKREEGDAFVSVVFFNDKSDVLLDRVNIKDVKELTEDDYVCISCTALLDAVGDSIKHIKNIHKYARKEDIPEKTVFVIITDGLENASKKYRYYDVKKLIERVKEESKWEFLFLGANIDAIGEAKNLGIEKDYAVEFCCDERGIELNYESVSNAVKIMRCCDKKIGSGWKKDIEEDLKKRK
ncbi:vWA domain-containing protein [Peptacetobacter sp.]|uniref:vWA domain-containing protein n=1 Tax=Peptacetobacter sp. TaxID=2991975 RepID=UPI002613D827|nr:vWA domain-containing protein [Peptacetobacter sp.]